MYVRIGFQWLSNINVKKGSWSGKIPCELLNELSEEYAQTLAIFLMQTIKDVKVSHDWMNNSYLAVYQKDNSLPLTNVSCKLLEHTICRQHTFSII